MSRRWTLPIEVDYNPSHVRGQVRVVYHCNQCGKTKDFTDVLRYKVESALRGGRVSLRVLQGNAEAREYLLNMMNRILNERYEYTCVECQDKDYESELRATGKKAVDKAGEV